MLLHAKALQSTCIETLNDHEVKRTCRGSSPAFIECLVLACLSVPTDQNQEVSTTRYYWHEAQQNDMEFLYIAMWWFGPCRILSHWREAGRMTSWAKNQIAKHLARWIIKLIVLNLQCYQYSINSPRECYSLSCITIIYQSRATWKLMAGYLAKFVLSPLCRYLGLALDLLLGNPTRLNSARPRPKLTCFAGKSALYKVSICY